MKQKQKNKNNNFKILENFKKELSHSKKLIKQLYKDIYNLNKDLFINEEITYELFLFRYYSLIEKNINLNNPDYPGLVEKLNSVIKNNILKNKQNREKNDEIEELYNNAEWELINKYKSSIEIEQRLREKKEKEKKMKNYEEELNKQIELNKILKNKKDENILIKKEDKFLLNESEAKKELRQIKIEQNDDKEINDKINEININNIDEYMDKDELITKIVDNILMKKKEEKIDNILNGIKSKYFLENKNFIIPEIKYDKKNIDDILYKEMQQYQDI